MAVLLKDFIYIHGEGIWAETCTTGIFHLTTSLTNHHVFARKLVILPYLPIFRLFFVEHPIASHIVLYKFHELNRKKRLFMPQLDTQSEMKQIIFYSCETHQEKKTNIEFRSQISQS